MWKCRNSWELFALQQVWTASNLTQVNCTKTCVSRLLSNFAFSLDSAHTTLDGKSSECWTNIWLRLQFNVWRQLARNRQTFLCWLQAFRLDEAFTKNSVDSAATSDFKAKTDLRAWNLLTLWQIKIFSSHLIEWRRAARKRIKSRMWENPINISITFSSFIGHEAALTVVLS